MSFALVTGASSGIGKNISCILYERGYALILVSRNKQGLSQVKSEIIARYGNERDILILDRDLSKSEDCFDVINEINDLDVQVVINNAGFGVFGKCIESELNKELNMIDLNIRAVHIFTKYFVKRFSTINKGYILNVASFAGFMPGPLFASYYATKSYVVRYTQSVQFELKKNKSNIVLSLLCPGPVDTAFNSRAGVSFAVKGLSAEFVAKYAVKQLFNNKKLIIPGVFPKIGRVFTKILPDNLLCALGYSFQLKKKDG